MVNRFALVILQSLILQCLCACGSASVGDFISFEFVPSDSSNLEFAQDDIGGAKNLIAAVPLVKKNVLEVLAAETPNHSCFWLQSTLLGGDGWIPAEEGGLYENGGINECYALDDCDGGMGLSELHDASTGLVIGRGGCYKWAETANAPASGWGKDLAFNVLLNDGLQYRILMEIKGTCPINYELVEYSEALLIANETCSTVANSYQIIRLAGKASMDGASYGCSVRENDDRGFGHSLCKQLLDNQ